MAIATRCLDDFLSILTSREVTFLIGPSRMAFHVNEKLVASCSEVFRKMLTNRMRESQEGVVELDDVEPRVFTSFIQYTLCGNYQVPGPVDEMEIVVETGDKEALFLRDWELWSFATRPRTFDINGKPLSSPQYAAAFIRQGDACMPYAKPPGLPAREISDTDEYVDLSFAESRFAMICGHHVKLYIFADMYDVVDLRQLCLHRLHRSLAYRLLRSVVHAKLGDAEYQHLFDAVAFVFENTCTGDKIRKLFVQACAADFSLVCLMSGYKDLCLRVPEVAYEMTMELHIKRTEHYSGKAIE
ncbi:hypothetical protein LY76DRAFT_619056 [Colletotrichum caudatum]|nr:hypothetical protein LY76DRAFT_619056 [Colletotrichum caudatum]